jgi:hypothetical protein
MRLAASARESSRPVGRGPHPRHHQRLQHGGFLRYMTDGDVAAPLILLRNPARERSSEVNGAMAAGRLAWKERLVRKRTRRAARDAQQEGSSA